MQATSTGSAHPLLPPPSPPAFPPPPFFLPSTHPPTNFAALQLLWTEKLRINTVHVDDVTVALWTIANHGAKGEAYNLADKGDTSEPTALPASDCWID